MRLSWTRLVWEMVYCHLLPASLALSSTAEHNLSECPSWTALPAWTHTRASSAHAPPNTQQLHVTCTSVHAPPRPCMHLHSTPVCIASPSALLAAERASFPASVLVPPSSSESPSAQEYNQQAHLTVCTSQNSLYIICIEHVLAHPLHVQTPTPCTCTRMYSLHACIHPCTHTLSAAMWAA